MRLLLDMNLPRSLAGSLRSAGHDVVHGREIGLESASDDVVFARAAADSRTVVTLDLGFADIVRFAGAARNGLVLLRLRSLRPSHMRQRLMKALVETEAALASGAVVVVEDSRIRIRSFPKKD